MGAPADDNGTLLDVASSISDGAGVDWRGVAAQAASDEATAAIVTQLEIVERIARVHAAARGWDSLDLRGTIGTGSFGIVYRAFDRDLERDVALKVLPIGGGHGGDAERALNEARMLARVKHPNVVTVFRADRYGEEIGLCMEFINGRTLDDLVRTHGPLSAREATLVGLDLCRALAAVHSAGLIHGDIKAHNVMREAGGRIVLMDFGAGRDLRREHNPAAGDFAGTPLYVAPEVFRGDARSKASDIYSLGVLLYYLVSAKYPVEGSTRSEIGRQHDRHGPPRRLRDARPDLPAPFVAAVERALADDPARRYLSAGDFEAALVDALPRRDRRRPIVVAAAITATIVLAALLAYGLAPGSRTPAVSLPSAPAAAAATYDIDAGLYRVRGTTPERLAAGARVEPGDRLFMRVRASTPAYVYIINEDERGESYLLFPLPGQSAAALPAGQSHELPGVREGERLYWQVTSAGGREHFLIFANPDRLTTFEGLFASLPAPSAEQAVASARLSREAVDILRGVGGLAATASGANASMGLAQQFTTPLAEGPETVSGVWVRRVTVENPGR